MKKFSYTLNGRQVARKDINKLWGSSFVLTMQKRARYYGTTTVQRYYGVAGAIYEVGVSLISE